MSVLRGYHVMNPCGAWRSRELWSAGLKEQRQSSTPHTPRVDSNTHVNTFLNNPTGGEITPARILSNLWPVECELIFTMNSKIPESWHWMQGVSVLPIVTHRSVCSISTQLLVWSQKNAASPVSNNEVLIQSIPGFNLHLKKSEQMTTGTQFWSVIIMWLGHLYHGTFRWV